MLTENKEMVLFPNRLWDVLFNGIDSLWLW